MPRHPDPKLEGKILDAAQKLLRKGSEKAVTMRAVASAAGTNTPAVYRRFRNRKDVVLGLMRRLQNESADIVRSSHTPEEACQRYLEFALVRRHEYELFYRYAYQLPRPTKTGAALRDHRPTTKVMEEKLAEHLGGKPGDYSRLSLSLWALTHGTAMILISGSIPAEYEGDLRSVFQDTVRTLINRPRAA